MKYIVLELFPAPWIVTNKHGEQYLFEDLELAKEKAEECQQGMVVPLNPNLINQIEELGLKKYFL
jgi:hypothetical protein